MSRYLFGPATVDCHLPLPGLRPCTAGGGADISVRLAPGEVAAAGWAKLFDEHPSDGGPRTRRWRGADGGRRIRFDYRREYADFVIAPAAGRIEIRCSSAAAEAELPALLEGGVLGAALRLRGVTALHANAVAADGKAVLLAGGSGAGKSSLAWALLRQGCRLIGDDLAAVEPANGAMIVHGGRTGLRMWADAAKRLAVPQEQLAALFPMLEKGEKKTVYETSAIEPGPLALHAVYLLGPRDPDAVAPAIAEVAPSARLALLAANLYGSLDPGVEARRRELAVLAEIAHSLPVRRLVLPDRLDALPAAAAQLRRLLFS